MAVLAVVAAGPGMAGAGPALDPLDLALVRGEAVFEAVRVYGGRPFRLRAHLDRLAASAAALELALPDGLEALAARAVAAAGGGDAVLRIICTKGREGEGGPATPSTPHPSTSASWPASPAPSCASWRPASASRSWKASSPPRTWPPPTRPSCPARPGRSCP